MRARAEAGADAKEIIFSSASSLGYPLFRFAKILLALLVPPRQSPKVSNGPVLVPVVQRNNQTLWFSRLGSFAGKIRDELPRKGLYVRGWHSTIKSLSEAVRRHSRGIRRQAEATFFSPPQRDGIEAALGDNAPSIPEGRNTFGVII